MRGKTTNNFSSSQINRLKNTFANDKLHIFNKRRHNIATEAPVESQHLAVHLDGSLNLTLSVSLTELYNPKDATSQL